MPSQESIRALRTLILPISPAADFEIKCAKVLEDSLLNRGILNTDFLNWTTTSLEQWEETQVPPDDLKKIVQSILLVAGDLATEALSQHYFSIHLKLIEEHFFSHAEGRWFLSHSFMILELASKSMLTSAQIARMLAVRDGRARFNRHTTETFLNKMQLGPSLTIEQIEKLFESDKEQEGAYFADSSLGEAAIMLDTAARSLGYAGKLADNLQTLANQKEIGKYAPYLQILHFQCTLAEYFDHAVTDLYEFRPRGIAALWLFGAYPDALSNAGNPFLNNAKSVERADAGWVRMKKKAERPGTAALEGILSNLEEMGFAARRELARLIRLWLHRIIRFTQPLTDLLPDSLTEEKWNKLLGNVGNANSATYGILEQRILDALSWGEHLNGWRSRGIGASVNATNISTRRLGDCDYQSSETKSIFAYESHGGTLTDIYVKEHIRTFKKSFILRREELEGIAEISEWTINVNFVAHNLKLQEFSNGDRIELEDVKITLYFQTFNEIINQWLTAQPNYDDLNRLIITPLQQKNTPSEVRRTLLTLSE